MCYRLEKEENIQEHFRKMKWIIRKKNKKKKNTNEKGKINTETIIRSMIKREKEV